MLLARDHQTSHRPGSAAGRPCVRYNKHGWYTTSQSEHVASRALYGVAVVVVVVVVAAVVAAADDRKSCSGNGQALVLRYKKKKKF